MIQDICVKNYLLFFRMTTSGVVSITENEHLPSPCFQTDSFQREADNLASHYIWSLNVPISSATEETKVRMKIAIQRYLNSKNISFN